MALRPGQVHYSPEKAICIQKQYPVNKTAPRLKLPIDTYLSNLQARLLTELDVLGPAQDCTELSTVFNSSPLLMFTTSSWNCYFALHLPWRISSQIDQMPLRFLLFVCDLFSSESWPEKKRIVRWYPLMKEHPSRCFHKFFDSSIKGVKVRGFWCKYVMRRHSAFSGSYGTGKTWTWCECFFFKSKDHFAFQRGNYWAFVEKSIASARNFWTLAVLIFQCCPRRKCDMCGVIGAEKPHDEEGYSFPLLRFSFSIRWMFRLRQIPKIGNLSRQQNPSKLFRKTSRKKTRTMKTFDFLSVTKTSWM